MKLIKNKNYFIYFVVLYYFIIYSCIKKTQYIFDCAYKMLSVMLQETNSYIVVLYIITIIEQ